MRNKKRYAVVIDTYVYADNDYMARKMGHNLPWQQSSTKDGVNYFKLDEELA